MHTYAIIHISVYIHAQSHTHIIYHISHRERESDIYIYINIYNWARKMMTTREIPTILALSRPRGSSLLRRRCAQPPPGHGRHGRRVAGDGAGGAAVEPCESGAASADAGAADGWTAGGKKIHRSGGFLMIFFMVFL